jgi:hypothetical protein
MMYGKPVKYVGANGVAPLAFIASKDEGPLADLLVFDENGAGTVHKDVPRNEEQKDAGHTWHMP